MAANLQKKWYLLIQGYAANETDEDEALRQGLEKIPLHAATEEAALAEALIHWGTRVGGGRFRAPDGTTYPRSPRLIAVTELGWADGLPDAAAEAPPLPFPTFMIQVDYICPVTELIRQGDYQYVNAGLKTTLPEMDRRETRRGPGRQRVCLMPIEMGTFAKDIPEKLRGAGLRMATVRELLCFGSQHPAEQVNGYITVYSTDGRILPTLGYNYPGCPNGRQLLHLDGTESSKRPLQLLCTPT